jgi:hypothetical protein
MYPRRPLCRFILWCLCGSVAIAQPALHLRTRTIFVTQPLVETGGQPGLPAQASVSVPAPEPWEGVRHWLIQVSSNEPEDLMELEAAGIHILGAVPDSAYVVGASVRPDRERFRLLYAEPIAAEDKISPALFELANPADEFLAERRWVLVLFHQDVASADVAAGIEGLSNELQQAAAPSPHTLVLLASAEDLRLLSARDVVSYILPASEELLRGELVSDCLSTHAGPLHPAALAASIGAGWDGPGAGRASLTWIVNNTSQSRSFDAVRSDVERALGSWAAVAALSFFPGSRRASTRQIDVTFATGVTGTGFDFAPGTNTLAQSFYPSPPNPETLAGDIYVNDNFRWAPAGNRDLFAVLLHEIGHSLGLGHSDTPGSVMYPIYSGRTTLAEEDVASIRQLYAAVQPGGATVAPSPTTPTAPAAAALSAFSVRFPQGTQAVTSATTATLSGIFGAASAGLRITWRNELTRGNGVAVLDLARNVWTITGLNLQTGLNNIQITATQNGQSRALFFLFDRRAPLTVDRTAPTVRLTAPAGSPFTTTATDAVLVGTAIDAGGIRNLRWENQSSGRNGTLPTADSFRVSVPLQKGLNLLRVLATDAAGNIGVVFVSVTQL